MTQAPGRPGFLPWRQAGLGTELQAAGPPAQPSALPASHPTLDIFQQSLHVGGSRGSCTGSQSEKKKSPQGCPGSDLLAYSASSCTLHCCSVISDSMQPHGLQHTRPPYPSPSPGACSNSCPLRRWCHPTISSSFPPAHIQHNSSTVTPSSSWSWPQHGSLTLEVEVRETTFLEDSVLAAASRPAHRSLSFGPIKAKPKEGESTGSKQAEWKGQNNKRHLWAPVWGKHALSPGLSPGLRLEKKYFIRALTPFPLATVSP